MGRCPACGYENADSAKFCSECGTSLRAASAAREERKVVSVVFVDLVGSTARAESSDPEDVRALLRVYHEKAREELEKRGGTVEKFIGDAVVAVFGAPVSHEDDPERAVRAALAVRDAVARLNEEEPGRDLHVRVAVNTGEALVSLDASPDEGEGMVAGDVVNTAARLQSAAPIDGILVGEQTFRATDRRIVYREADFVEAKGKAEPVAVWEAIEPRARFGIDLGGAGRAPLVGRDRELDLLVAALQRAREDRSTQLVTLVGVPGIGKSRLLFELSRVVDADEELIVWRQGRSLPYGEGASYWALGEIVKAQAGILESDAADVTEAKLGEAVEIVEDPGERAWVERHLRPLVGLAGDDLSAGDRRGEAFSAWRRFVEMLALGGPTVLVFEDVHWADDGLLDFVDGLVDWVDGVPLLVVCTARPELLERRPGWGGGKRNATTVSLAPLGDEETTRLLLALLERSVIDADTQRELVERAAGNPLYAEEFVRMIDAGGSVEGRLPESVQGIVTARIDLLPPEEKQLVQHAAVLGKVFWSDALATVANLEPWQLHDALRSLERKEFIRREHRSAVAGASQHAFQHALVRDAAYGQIPRAARAARHVAAAEWIESLPDDRAEDRAASVAHHYVTAIELFRAAGEDESFVRARAARALQDAGERALLLHSYPAAANFLDQALDLLPDGEEPSAELLLAAGTAFGYVGRIGDALPRAIEAFERAGDPERAAEAAVMACRHSWHALSADVDVWLERASRLVEDRPPSRAKALVVSERARRAMLSYRPKLGHELALAALDLAREVGDAEIEAHTLVTLGCSRVALGDAGGVHDLEVALDLVGHRGSVAGRALTNLGWAYAVIGDLRRAGRAAEERVERAEQEGEIQGAWFTRGNVVSNYYSLGKWDEALVVVGHFDDAPEGARYAEGAARIARALILAARGQLASPVDELRDVVELYGAAGEQGVWPYLATYARHARRADRRDEAEITLDGLMQEIVEHDSVGDAQEWHVELVLALSEAGRSTQANEIVGRLIPGPWRDASAAVVEGRFADAADVLDATGEQPLQAELRLLAARVLAAEGRQTEATEQLERARAFWRSVGATTYLREADETIAAAS
ncbi:MAG TPA: adenylate/guanylate cyclase domain-containing protein [Gaiellaceae bacterium]|nr:adenylate/guanylate cyclase domain-containing protein [Gaiellaceae bacterium]